MPDAAEVIGLAQLIISALADNRLDMRDGDILVIASKIVSSRQVTVLPAAEEQARGLAPRWASPS